MDFIETAFSIQHIVDQEGRPLRESAAPPSLKEHAPMELQGCPYKGSRHGHPNPMNKSALDQMHRHWDEILDTLEFLRNLYISETKPEKLSMLDLLRIGEMGALLPRYLVYRGNHPVSGQDLPAPVAGIYKVLIGVNAAVLKVAQHDLLSGANSLEALSDVDRFFEFIEAHGLLIGQAQVCAGPEKMIKFFLEKLIFGKGGKKDQPLVHAQPVVPESIRAFIPDPKPFYRFSSDMTDVRLLSQIFMVADHLIAIDLRKQLENADPQIGSVVATSMAELDQLAQLPVEVRMHVLGGLSSRVKPIHDADSEELTECIGSIPTVFGSQSKLQKEIEAELQFTLKSRPEAVTKLAPALAHSVGTYLQLEKTYGKITVLYKNRVAKTLQLQDSSPEFAKLRLEEFSPPSRLTRSLLALFGSTVRSDHGLRLGRLWV